MTFIAVVIALPLACCCVTLFGIAVCSDSSGPQFSCFKYIWIFLKFAFDTVSTAYLGSVGS